jgi:hypothetical protein
MLAQANELPQAQLQLLRGVESTESTPMDKLVDPFEPVPATMVMDGGRILANEAVGGYEVYSRNLDVDMKTDMNEIMPAEKNVEDEQVFVEGKGGGIYVGDSAVLSMTAGRIEENRAFEGGGISMETNVVILTLLRSVGETVQSGIVDLFGGSIIGNVAETDGGGIWVDYRSLDHLSVGRDVTFAGNLAAVAYDRSAHDDALYGAQIASSTWTYPLAQGYNNFDISYTGGTPVGSHSVTYQPGTYGTFEPVTYVGVMTGTTTPAEPKVSGQDGYTFMGWSPAKTPTVTGTVIYVAQWKADGEVDGSSGTTPPPVGGATTPPNVTGAPKTGDESPLGWLTALAMLGFMIAVVAIGERVLAQKKNYS